jgi:hypothetical protein
MEGIYEKTATTTDGYFTYESVYLWSLFKQWWILAESDKKK